MHGLQMIKSPIMQSQEIELIEVYALVGVPYFVVRNSNFNNMVISTMLLIGDTL